MKRDFLAMWLVGVLILATLTTVGMCYMYLRTAQNVRDLQGKMNQVNYRRQAIQALAIDLNEYAKRNRAIIPLLEELSLRPRAATNPPVATGGSK